jgi:hypothetical protein
LKEYCERRGWTQRVARRSRFKEYAQLPEGRWYPTRWDLDVTADDKPYPNMRVTAYRLQIFPGRKLDPSWYTDPGKHIVTNP